VLELTEHNPVDDYPTLLDALDRFRRWGGRIAIDDTGAGYASFQHLLWLHPDIIKLDITLTRGINADPARRALAGALVGFATEIGAIIIAEGIEIPGDLAALQRIGIPWGQGYYLARPGGLPLTDRRLPILRQEPRPTMAS
jgi:EAL domain-containing protein (putative c-di-GMP-specific phosphodiesterase class I)